MSKSSPLFLRARSVYCMVCSAFMAMRKICLPQNSRLCYGIGRRKQGAGTTNIKPAQTTLRPKARQGMATNTGKAGKAGTQAQAQAPTCTICGKVLKNATAIKAGAGKVCLHNSTHAPKTPPKVATSIPKGYTKLSLFKPLIKSKAPTIAGLTVTKLVNCIGRDKGAGALAHAICQPTYVNNVRYVNSWLATQAGLQAIATGNFSKAPSGNYVGKPAK